MKECNEEEITKMNKICPVIIQKKKKEDAFTKMKNEKAIENNATTVQKIKSDIECMKSGLNDSIKIFKEYEKIENKEKYKKFKEDHKIIERNYWDRFQQDKYLHKNKYDYKDSLRKYKEKEEYLKNYGYNI